MLYISRYSYNSKHANIDEQLRQLRAYVMVIITQQEKMPARRDASLGKTLKHNVIPIDPMNRYRW